MIFIYNHSTNDYKICLVFLLLTKVATGNPHNISLNGGGLDPTSDLKLLLCVTTYSR